MKNKKGYKMNNNESDQGLAVILIGVLVVTVVAILGGVIGHNIATGCWGMLGCF